MLKPRSFAEFNANREMCGYLFACVFVCVCISTTIQILSYL